VFSEDVSLFLFSLVIRVLGESILEFFLYYSLHICDKIKNDMPSKIIVVF